MLQTQVPMVRAATWLLLSWRWRGQTPLLTRQAPTLGGEWRSDRAMPSRQHMSQGRQTRCPPSRVTSSLYTMAAAHRRSPVNGMRRMMTRKARPRQRRRCQCLRPSAAASHGRSGKRRCGACSGGVPALRTWRRTWACPCAQCTAGFALRGSPGPLPTPPWRHTSGKRQCDR